MRKFSSYGLIDNEIHYHVPRNKLIESAYNQLIGDSPEKDGHYITVWAPRQTGKTWIMREVVRRMQAAGGFEVGMITLQGAKGIEDQKEILDIFVDELNEQFKLDIPLIDRWQQVSTLFSRTYFEKPIILIIDEFDSLAEEFINAFANQFRTIHTKRSFDSENTSIDKNILLHGLALIGVQSVLGIDNESGSPFNVQRSVHIPNLTADEVNNLFHSYMEESGQPIEQGVIDQLFDETQGQPGLVSWFGELLTTKYNDHPDQPITTAQFDRTLLWAFQGLPNNNVLNIISKARMKPYDQQILQLFKTDKPLKFSFDNRNLNFLYMNGAITIGEEADNLYAKFASPFVQKRLFNYFTDELFPDPDNLYELFTDLSTIITDTHLDVGELARLYENYIQQNSGWLFKNAPTRATDGRIFEAVYHFNFFAYLREFMRSYDSQVIPEFPTGNGKIDLLIQHAGQLYGLELKSFVNQRMYEKARTQAAKYARKLGIDEIWLIFFVDRVDDDNRRKYEVSYLDREVPTQPITVQPRLIAVAT